jgi:hypothetical protein
MIRPTNRQSLILVWLWAAALPTGCGTNKGQPAPPQLVPVSGRVVYKGKPVPMVGISFIPEEAKGVRGFQASGGTKADGTFTLQTHPYGPGAAPGRYTVTLASEARGQFPEKYGDFSQSPLKVEIKEQGAPNLLLQLTD